MKTTSKMKMKGLTMTLRSLVTTTMPRTPVPLRRSQPALRRTGR
jgi:hypothetical protein